MRHSLLPALLIFSLSLHAGSGFVRAGDAAKSSKIIEEVPTLQCLGVRWLIGGDDNANATISVQYRKLGDPKWKTGMNLFRIQREDMRKENRPPMGKTLYAGSIFYLEEATNYEVQLSLHDEDGGSIKKTIRMKTWTEPVLPKKGRRILVQPTQLKESLAKARPGDTLILGPGVYKGTFTPPSGVHGKPIAIIGSKNGETILDGLSSKNVIAGRGLQHVMFQNITFRNATWAIAVNGGAHITVRHCHFKDVDYAFVGQQKGNEQKHFYIADNVIQGRSTWPRSKGIEGRRGIQVGGQGHVICHNRISGFADGINVFPAYPTSAIDIYRNDISECTDDGIEMDFSDYNTRCFENRLTNIFQGISLQPVHGGPVYVFRNALYNVALETFKLHNNLSGALLFHNTSVKAGMPLCLYTSDSVRNCISRNNLFIGTVGNYAYENMAPMQNCDFDYDGFSGQWKTFLKWNKKRYVTMEDAKADGIYSHAVHIKKKLIFRSGITAPNHSDTQFKTRNNDLRLKAKNRAIDSGIVIKNINDGYRGKSPDLGAYELGLPLPHYGPRPNTN